MENSSKKVTGFALLDKDKRRLIASKAGRAAHRLGKAHEWTREEAIAAGKKSAAIRKKKND